MQISHMHLRSLHNVMFLLALGFEVRCTSPASTFDSRSTASSPGNGGEALRPRGLESDDPTVRHKAPDFSKDDRKERYYERHGQNLEPEVELEKLKARLDRLKLKNKDIEQFKLPQQATTSRAKDEQRAEEQQDEREELQRLMLEPSNLKSAETRLARKTQLTTEQRLAERSRQMQETRRAKLQMKNPEKANRFAMQQLLRQEPHGLDKGERERLAALREEFTGKAEGGWPSTRPRPPIPIVKIRPDPWQPDKVHTTYRLPTEQTTRPPRQHQQLVRTRDHGAEVKPRPADRDLRAYNSAFKEYLIQAPHASPHHEGDHASSRQSLSSVSVLGSTLAKRPESRTVSDSRAAQAWCDEVHECDLDRVVGKYQ